MHELTHFAEQSDTYGEFSKSLLAIKYGNDYANSAQYQSDIATIQKRYGEVVDNFTEDDTMREIVADLTGEMLYYDQETLNRLVAEQPTPWQRIANWFDNIIAKFNGINDPEIEQMKQTRAMFETALQEAKQGNGDTRYSLPGKKGNSLLSNEEYGRLQSNLFDAKHRGYRFEPRLNGGYMVDMGNLLVYTNKRGTPEHVLEINVADGDTFTENDIVQDAIECEKEGMDYELCEIILQSSYGTGSAYFRKSGAGEAIDRQNSRRQDAMREQWAKEIEAKYPLKVKYRAEK